MRPQPPFPTIGMCPNGEQWSSLSQLLASSVQLAMRLMQAGHFMQQAYVHNEGGIVLGVLVPVVGRGLLPHHGVLGGTSSVHCNEASTCAHAMESIYAMELIV